MLIPFLHVAVHAEEMPDDYKEYTKDNYWAELNWFQNDNYKGVVPTYLNDYFTSSRLSWYNRLNYDELVPFFPSTGFSSSPQVDSDVLDVINQWFGTYAKDLPHRQPTDPTLNRWPGGKQWNPYNFNYATELLNEGITDYNARADIRERGLSSTAVIEHMIGDTVNLDFDVDVSLLKKTLLTQFISILNSEFPAYYMMKDNMPETAITQSDGELVFVMDLPKGLESLDSTTYTLTGIDGLTLSVTKENDGRRIVVKARLKAPTNYEMLKDVYAKIRLVNSVKLSIDGLKVTADIEPNQNSTVTGYVYGAYELIHTTDNNAILNQDATATENDNRHHIDRNTIVFAGRQLASGKDDGGDANKPELITYSLRVNQNKVTFINDGTTHVVVNVEPGKSIDADVLTNQSMPLNPSRTGFFTFKEWNTAADGTGSAFTGSTTVNNDITVYAIYTAVNQAPVLEVKNTTIYQGDNLDLLTLVVSADDYEDGNILNRVQIINDGGFNKDVLGTYSITYKVLDNEGLSATQVATVTVIAKASVKTADTTSTPMYTTLFGFSMIAAMLLWIFKKQKLSTFQ
jgi:hypothetical protein